MNGLYKCLYKKYGRRFLALVVALIMLTLNTVFAFEDYSYGEYDAHIISTQEYGSDPDCYLQDEYEVVDEDEPEIGALFAPFSTPIPVASQVELEAALLIPDAHIILTSDFNVNGPVVIPVGISAIITGADRTISIVSGGGFFVPSGAELVLESINLVNSNSPLATGLVVTGGTATITGNSLISGFTNSGARVQSFGTLTMTGGTISGNTAQDGSGVRVESGSSFIMEGGEISGNNTLSPWGGGGGVFVHGGVGWLGITTTFVMAGGTISGNTTGWNGGGIFVHGGGVGNNATFTMTGGTISGNTAGVFGGGVRMESGSIFTMEDGEISGNSAQGSGPAQGGGGVAVTESEFIMAGGAISGNTAQRGGGVIAATNSTFIMEGGTISNNTAQLNGGGVFVDWVSNFTTDDSAISHNTAENNGGGIFAALFTNLTIGSTAIFSGNTASSAHDFFRHPNFIPGGGAVSAINSGGDGAMGGNVASINWALNSIGGTHALNNYDINFVGFTITTQNIAFNPNNGVFIGANQLPTRLISSMGTYAPAFDANGNLLNPNLAHPTKAGHTFGGWFDTQTNANGTTQTGRVLHTDSVTTNPYRTLWARWMPIPIPTPTSTPTQTPTPTSTPTSSPTQTPIPTPTPASTPTQTPAPMPTPTPTFTPAPTPILPGFEYGSRGSGGGYNDRRDRRPTNPSARHPLQNRPELLPGLGLEMHGQDITPYIERFRRRFIFGYPDGTVRPSGHMTRAEMIQVFFNISPVARFHATETRFSDVDVNDWFFQAVAYLESLGIIHGFPDGSLRPNEPITNAEFAALTVNFFNLKSLIEPDLLLEAESHWGANYVNLGFARGWFEYFGISETFNPDSPISRGQAVALLNFYQGRLPCIHAINTFLASTNRLIFPDLLRGHWTFYEIMEATFTRYYYFNSDGTETWLNVLD